MKDKGDMPKSFKEGFMRWAVAAGAASFAESATFPLVVLSARQQLLKVSDDFPKEQIKARHNMFKLGRAIVKGEGVGALYSGVPASILRQAIYGGIGIGLYPLARKIIVGPNTSKKDVPLWKRMLAASSTGAFGQLVGNPTDVVRVRMATGGAPSSEAKGSSKPYRSTLHAFGRIARDEGFSAFYSGVVPSVVRAAVINGCGIASYDHTKQAVIRILGTNDGLGPQVLGSSMSGLVSATVSTPFDVIKSKQQRT